MYVGVWSGVVGCGRKKNPKKDFKGKKKHKKARGKKLKSENNQMSRKHDPWRRIKRTGVACLKDKIDRGI